jgi:hypothetical protein
MAAYYDNTYSTTATNWWDVTNTPSRETYTYGIDYAFVGYGAAEFAALPSRADRQRASSLAGTRAAARVRNAARKPTKMRRASPPELNAAMQVRARTMRTK